MPAPPGGSALRDAGVSSAGRLVAARGGDMAPGRRAAAASHPVAAANRRRDGRAAQEAAADHQSWLESFRQRAARTRGRLAAQNLAPDGFPAGLPPGAEQAAARLAAAAEPPAALAATAGRWAAPSRALRFGDECSAAQTDLRSVQASPARAMVRQLPLALQSQTLQERSRPVPGRKALRRLPARPLRLQPPVAPRVRASRPERAPAPQLPPVHVSRDRARARRPARTRRRAMRRSQAAGWS